MPASGYSDTLIVRMLRAITYLEDDSTLQKVYIHNISANAMFICCARQKLKQRKNVGISAKGAIA